MKTVLIVDDSATARNIIRRCLEIAGLRGWTFLEAENGADALDQLASTTIDIVFSDLFMPKVPGDELLRRMKESQRTSEIPVFIISSAGSLAKIKELLDGGAYAVLNKPVSPSAIAPLLKELNI